jgi:hypothetical protein
MRLPTASGHRRTRSILEDVADCALSASETFVPHTRRRFRESSTHPARPVRILPL